MFDAYTLKARVYPMILLIFPLILMGIFYSIEMKSFLPLGSSALIGGTFSYLFSQLGRDKGKTKEQLLWKSWGGTPTTQILRLTNDIIDKHSKKRYHKKLHSICPVSIVPNREMEMSSPAKADDIYRTWTKYLISKTRDVKAYDLLFKDNCSYGFRRNVWGLKPTAIFCISILIICNFAYGYYQTTSINPMLYSVNVLYSIIGLLICLLFWIVVISKNWIKIPAFSYAERLCEAIENL